MKLPKPVADYVKAQNARDAAALCACFSTRAFVHDEGLDHRGAAAVKRWIEDTLAKYEFQIEPIGISGSGPESVLTAKLSGSFPGSPVTMDFHFKVAKGQVSSLIIQPHDAT